MYKTMQRCLSAAAILVLVTGLGASSAQAQEKKLAITPTGQKTNMWCWATTLQMSVSVSGTAVTQCSQADAKFGRNDCCNLPTPAACINGGWPDYARITYNSLTTPWGTALTFAQLRAEIDAGRPTNFAWGWTGGGGHIMVASGYKIDGAGTQWVWINDPWPPDAGASSYITYAEYVRGNDHEHQMDYHGITCGRAYAGPGPQHRWRGDGNTADSAGATAGTISGTVSYAAAAMGQGFSVNGAGLVAFNSSDAYPGTGPLTVTARVQTSSSGTVQEIVSLYECGGLCPPGQANAIIDLSVTETGKLSAELRGNTNAAKKVTGAVTINDGQFHHVALVRDTTAALLRIFVDGVADGTVAIPVDNIFNSDNEMDPIQIGARRSAASSASAGYFKGTIDDVRWYQANLTATDVLALTCSP
jgi:hypothetical protein